MSKAITEVANQNIGFPVRFILPFRLTHQKHRGEMEICPDAVASVFTWR